MSAITFARVGPLRMVIAGPVGRAAGVGVGCVGTDVGVRLGVAGRVATIGAEVGVANGGDGVGVAANTVGWIRTETAVAGTGVALGDGSGGTGPHPTMTMISAIKEGQPIHRPGSRSGAVCPMLHGAPDMMDEELN